MKKLARILALILVCMADSPAQAHPFHPAFFQKRATLTDYADPTGMIALWRIDESSLTNGATVYDYFGKHNGTFVASSATTNYTITGKKFRAVSLNPTAPTTYISIPGSTDFNKNSSSTITVMLWFSRQGSNNNACIVNFAYDTSGNPWCLATGDTTSRMSFWDGVGNNFASVGTINMSTWYHYAVVLNGSSIKIYWNGALVKTTTGDTTTRTNKNVYIGRDSSEDIYTPCYVDEVSYWNRALSDAEILDIYNKQK